MARKAKIAISLAPEVLELVDRHAAGRSRSRCIEEELLRALRAREWERLSAQSNDDDRDEMLQWADSSFANVSAALERDERGARRPKRRRAQRAE